MEMEKKLYIITPEPQKPGWALCCVYNPNTDLYDQCTDVPETQLIEWIRRVRGRGGFVAYPFDN